MSELEQYEREIYELDARIGRLALACGADLSLSEVIVELIKGRFEVCANKTNLNAAGLLELRGLFILKYKIEDQLIEEFGATDFARIVAEQDALLSMRGFPERSLADVDAN
jgi:hypothetical protein